MGFWETLTKIGEKVPEIANSLKELSNDEGFQEHLGKVGTIGSLCLIGLDIYSKIKNDLQTDERRAFGALLKIVFESTKKCLDKADKIELKQLKTEDFINGLFDIFVQTGFKWDFDLPSNPVIDRFKEQILYTIKSNHYDDIDLRKFFVEFKIEMEYRAMVDEEIKALADQNIKPLYIEAKLQELSNDLRDYLEDLIKSLRDEVSPLDKKRLFQHYVQNKVILASVESWDKEDRDISVNNQWTIEDFLKGNDWRIVIGGTYGTGKTSFVKQLAVDFASRHLEAPIGIYNYIPVFVSLKEDGLTNVFNENDLDYVLENIIAPNIGKNRKILVIYDGLDEYQGNIEDLIKGFSDRHEQLRNLKQIITTRLEGGFEKTLGIKKYVRMVPFDKDQVNKFFSALKYNIPDVKYQTLEKYGLQDEKEKESPTARVKPLFCWMFGVIYLKSGLETYTQQPNVGKSLLYLNFIQSLFSKPYEVNFGKWIFRKIAALKTIYKDELIETTVKIWLRKFAEEEKKQRVSEFLEESRYEEFIKPFLSSYFRLQLGEKRPSPIIDFIHKTFKEYLLAEYYIESLLSHKPYRLNIGTPSKETIDFLDGLLEFINAEDNKSLEAQKIIEDLVNDGAITASEVRGKLIRYAQDLFHNEQIFIAVAEDYEEQKSELWVTHHMISERRYHEFWIHRWLALYVSNKLRPDWPVNGTKLEILIQSTAQTIPSYLKRLVKASLSKANLYGANLQGANLSGANLSGAILSNANLWNANLSGANLSGADLYNAYLYTANLSDANLAKAILTNANLYGAKLSNTVLSDANLYYIFCDEAFVKNTVYNEQQINSPNDLRALSGVKLVRGEDEW